MFPIASRGTIMSDNVVSFHGGKPVPASVEPEPVTILVQELERLLEAARAGEIVGFAGVYQHRNAMVGYSWAGAVSGYATIGGLECLKARLVQRAEAP